MLIISKGDPGSGPPSNKVIVAGSGALYQRSDIVRPVILYQSSDIVSGNRI